MKNFNLIDKAFLLKRTPLFNALDLDMLLTIADKVGLVLFDPNDYVFVVEEEANRMYFVVKGQVDLYSSDKSFICTLRSGDFFGEEALFNNRPRAYAAHTPIETHLLTLTRSNLYTIISECPSVALGFLQVYTSEIPFRPFRILEKDQ